MDGKDEAVRDLMAKLMQAVEASLATSSAVRDALADLVRNGYEARLFFVANAESAEETDAADSTSEPDSDSIEETDEDETYVVREVGATPETADLRFELTKLDQAFLKSLLIRPEGE